MLDSGGRSEIFALASHPGAEVTSLAPMVGQSMRQSAAANSLSATAACRLKPTYDASLAAQANIAR